MHTILATGAKFEVYVGLGQFVLRQATDVPKLNVRKVVNEFKTTHSNLTSSYPRITALDVSKGWRARRVAQTTRTRSLLTKCGGARNPRWRYLRELMSVV